jgi:hypothetical protein
VEYVTHFILINFFKDQTCGAWQWYYFQDLSDGSVGSLSSSGNKTGFYWRKFFLYA